MTGSSNDRDVTRTSATTIQIQLSAAEYEKLFVQSGIAKNTVISHLGNPTLLGTLGFLIPLTITSLCLLQLRGASPASLVSISGTWYFCGGVALIIAGFGEFLIGNTFPFTVFIVYGCHFFNLAYTIGPEHGIAASYTRGNVSGENSTSFASGQGMYFVMIAAISLLFFLGSLRTNLPFVLVFLSLCFHFAFLAAAQFGISSSITAQDSTDVLRLLKIAGGFGLTAALSGWYLAVGLVCASTGIYCPLPQMKLNEWIRGTGQGKETV